MENFFTVFGQIVFVIGVLGIGFGILYNFYDEYKIKYEMRKEEEYKKSNGVLYIVIRRSSYLLDYYYEGEQLGEITFEEQFK